MIYLSGHHEYCLTAECVKAAAQFMEMIDPNKNPCENFYNFACGKLIQEAVIPKDKIEIGPIVDDKDTLQQRLKKLLEAKSKDDEPSVFTSLRKLYSSCMDLDLIERVGREKILEKIQELGGWPVLQGKEFAKDTFVWQKLIEKARRMGFTIKQVLDTSIDMSSDNSSKNLMAINQTDFGLPREYLIQGSSNKRVQAYFKYMVDTAVYLGAKKQAAKQDLKNALNFEIELAKISFPVEEMKNFTALKNRMTIKELSRIYGDYDWLDHIKSILDSKEIKLEENEIVNVVTPKYFKALGAYLPTVDVRVIANYMIWRYVDSMMQYTDIKGLRIRLAFDKVMFGYETDPPRWERCVGHLGNLGHAVGSMYARTYFSTYKKYAAKRIGKNIKNEFKFMLPELKWLDEKSREQAKLKLEKMKTFMGYDDEILNKTLLNAFYKGLKLNSDHIIENVLTINKYLIEYETSQFRKHSKKFNWKRKIHGNVASFSFRYIDFENTIFFPAGFLDGVVFNVNRPNYMNYGAIGTYIGHAITHGFDDIGFQYDSEGNLSNWGSKDTKEEFNKKIECLTDQYSSYTVNVKGKTLHINGLTNQEQNTADNGGIKLAIRAYDRIIAENREEPRLPGLSYTPKQLFWLSAALPHCIAKKPEAWRDTVIRGDHAPQWFRVNSPLMNRKEFSRDWNCPMGSIMNPIKKCEVW